MNLERYKKDIETLIVRGNRLLLALLAEVAPDQAKKLNISDEDRKTLPYVRKEYQVWYSEALATIRQLMPHRVSDFIDYYKSSKPPKELNNSTYRISDYLQGITVSRGSELIVALSAAVNPLEQQVQIVEGLRQRLQSSLFDIRSLAQADLFDNELDAAEELNSKGFHRGAGAIA